MVRAKFRVTSLTKYEGGTSEIKLTPVSTGSEENKRFWTYTPSGIITFSCVNEEAVKEFEVGKEYYVDFTPAAD
jgi:hypothetical protein